MPPTHSHKTVSTSCRKEKQSLPIW